MAGYERDDEGADHAAPFDVRDVSESSYVPKLAQLCVAIEESTSRKRSDNLASQSRPVEIGDQKLHYVEADDGPLIVLLHGFPEFWFGWRLQIAPLAAAGFRVVAPDTRGYNLSSKPEGFETYGVDLLAADVKGFIEERGAESALLVGHDWGGSIAWTVAMNHREVVDRLAILNAAHPRRLSEGLHNPSQLRRSEERR